MPPIKVLHLIPTLSSGGAERQLTNVIGGMSRESIDHVVCVIGDADFFAPYIRKAGYKVIEMGIFAKHPFLRAASKFRKIIREEKPDIIHSRLYDASISSRLAKLLSSKQIPMVTSLELADYEPEIIRIGNWNPYKVRGLKAIDKITAFLAKPYFVPCSQFVKNSYQRNYGIDQSKTQVIYNAVDPKLLSASDDDLQKIRDELALPSDAFIYLNVGRLDPQKNHKVSFMAFRHVLKEIPNAVLLLAGVGGLEKELKMLAEDLGVGEKIHFLGRRSDVPALLELADVFVFPSFFEGHPVALVEAMFKSLPCIASRIEVFEEVIKDRESGLLVDPNSPDELAGAMIELYGKPELRKALGDNAFNVANKNFNISVTAKQWEDLYLRISRHKND